MDDDQFELARFTVAQGEGGSYDQALAELRAGSKRSHWMWFVFPQLAGLGSSAMAQRYAISGLPEARAYLAHPVLGPRLQACCEVLDGLPDLRRTAVQIFGPVDARKLHSSMTLFALADPQQPVFRQVLARYFESVEDSGTTSLLALQPAQPSGGKSPGPRA